MNNLLFEKYKLNSSITLANKIVMAPLTRCFADNDLVPTNKIAQYYARRADAGLIISEATIIDPLGQGYPNTPGIYTDAQIEGWKLATDAVHQQGGKIFCQLWHTGRVAHSIYTKQQPVAPSAVAWHGKVPRTAGLEYEMPHALTTQAVKQLVQKYIGAAKNAIKAGFDGVEIHGANGYLIDQFLRQDTNKRSDEYGGSETNRARFALEIVAGIIAAIGTDKVGIRLSPQAYVHLEYTNGDEQTYEYLLQQLSKKSICYVHLGAFNDQYIFDYLDGSKASEFIRKHYQGTFITCGSLYCCHRNYSDKK
ncbi:NADH-dependent flavin oxidoreductase, Oye family [hydrothermal vent metagenome]|uniref:NADH-dependent flavin oxidoreductase, Oye family n=1 Tax=hydrothermal vent metagenome TaxID=652676 RepID=A0A3B0VPG5_9ZZZZ